jgi:hypothetical protein
VETVSFFVLQAEKTRERARPIIRGLMFKKLEAKGGKIPLLFQLEKVGRTRAYSSGSGFIFYLIFGTFGKYESHNKRQGIQG